MNERQRVGDFSARCRSVEMTWAALRQAQGPPGSLAPQNGVEGVGVFLVVGVGAEVGVVAAIQEGLCAVGGVEAVEAFEGGEVALEGGAGVVPAAVVVGGGPEVAFGMGQDGPVAVGDELPDFLGGVDVADFQGVGDGQFDEDVIALPGQQPAVFADFGPGFGDEAVFHRRDQFQPDPGFVEGLLQPLAGGDDRRGRVPVQPRAVRGAHRALESVGREFPCEEDGFLHRPGAVVEARQDVAMAIVCGEFLHRDKDTKNCKLFIIFA